MKFRSYKTILIFLVLSNSNQLVAQSYEPMLTQLNEWHYTSCFNGCSSSVYYTDGDTLMNGSWYKILDGFHYISRSFLLSEDVSAKKVFLTKINPNKTDEFLLYDFSLQVGDSIDLLNPVSPFPLLAGYYTVDSIVLRPIADGNSYRHFYFSPSISNTQTSGNPIWIEGVGSLSLINAPAGDPDLNGAGALSCYYKDGVIRYSNLDSISSCNQEHFLGIKTFSNTSFFQVFPNPSNDYFDLGELENWKQLIIYSAQGNEVMRLENNMEGSIKHNLNAGVYIIQVEMDSNQKTTARLIVE